MDYVSRPRPRATLRACVLGGALLTLAASAGCFKPHLTYETLYGEHRVDLDGDYATGLSWTTDGRLLLQRRDGVLQKIEPVSGTATPAYDTAALAAALAKLPDCDQDTAKRLARRPLLTSDEFALAIIEHKNHLYAFDFAGGGLRKLTDTAVERQEVTLSPDRTRLAFVSDSNLYTLDIATGRQTQLTTDGRGDLVLNGILDWVYQEEIFGRGTWRAFWWSPDGGRLAYLRLDDTNVPTYPIVDYTETHPPVRYERYPKAGDPNPVPTLGIVAADGGATTWVSLAAYAGQDILIVGVDWTPAGEVEFAVQDRCGTWLDLCLADAATVKSRRLLHETTKAWVDLHRMPLWLKDGSFLWIAARDGRKHLYQHRASGELVRQVTSGEDQVETLLGVDARQENAYVTISNLHTMNSLPKPHLWTIAREDHVMRVPLSGGAPLLLTQRSYSHRVTVNKTLTHFVDTYSNASAPPRVALRDADGKIVRMISTNDAPKIRGYVFSAPEFLQVPTPRGYALNAMLIRPPGTSPFGRYPVMVSTYAGPGGPVVRNSWSRGLLFWQLLAQEGYFIWLIDPHSASGESEESAWQAYQRLGATELQDIEDSLRWLFKHEPVDPARVGIDGYSYGGFMVTYALTHSTLFKLGIAGGPVTDWRLYDTVYTEHYMRLPTDNAAGYEASSVLRAAHKLHGRLLLIHGVVDDNVHMQNTLQLMEKLQQAGLPFEAMFYPTDDHGIGHGSAHFRRLRYDFIRRNL